VELEEGSFVWEEGLCEDLRSIVASFVPSVGSKDKWVWKDDPVC
jgi:hypothetical protein